MNCCINPIKSTLAFFYLLLRTIKMKCIRLKMQTESGIEHAILPQCGEKGHQSFDQVN